MNSSTNVWPHLDAQNGLITNLYPKSILLLILNVSLLYVGCDDDPYASSSDLTAGSSSGGSLGEGAGTESNGSAGMFNSDLAGDSAEVLAGESAGTSTDSQVNPTEICLEDQDYLSEIAWVHIFSNSCVACHQAQGPASHTRMVFKTEQEPDWKMHNLTQVTSVIETREEGLPLLLLKPTGLHSQGHGGGLLIGRQSEDIQILISLTERILDITDDCGQLREGQTHISLAPPQDQCAELKPGRRLLRRLSHQEYQNTVRDLLGVDIDANASFVADAVEYGFDNHPERLDVSSLLVDQYREVAENLGDIVPLEDLLPCSLAAGNINCAHQFIKTFGERAYRRPLSHTEVDQYLSLYRLVVSQECFEQGIRWVITAMLQSPHFLYRSELGWRQEGGHNLFKLSSYELASEISYLLWQTMPDDELFEAASNGDLLDPTMMTAQIQRLLNDPRSGLTAQYFFFKWLQLDRLMQVVRDSEIYAALYFEIREAMVKESQLFIDELWHSDETLSALFLSTHSWANQDLASYYGVSTGAPHPQESGFYRIQVAPSRPAGILTHGSFLTTHAAPTSSSPIHRGVIVRERILCNHLDPPPEGLDIMPPVFDPDLTTRERFAAHTEEEICASCHRLIDPIGFGFESYDGIGRYREQEGTLPIDSSGALIRESDGSSFPFNGMAELADLLAQDEEVSACYARQWLRFSVGESEGLETQCYADWLSDQLTTHDYRLKSVINAITRTPHFMDRIGEADELDLPARDYLPLAQGDAPLAFVDTIGTTLDDLSCGLPPATSSSAGSGDPRITVDEREDRWDSGFCLYVTLTNTSEETVDGWSVQLNVEGTIDSVWNAMNSADSGSVTFTNVAWNNVIAPQASVEFGFCTAL